VIPQSPADYQVENQVKQNHLMKAQQMKLPQGKLEEKSFQEEGQHLVFKVIFLQF